MELVAPPRRNRSVDDVSAFVETARLRLRLVDELQEVLALEDFDQARMIAEVNPSQDQYESHPHALRIVALGRVMAVDTWRR